MKPRRLFLQAGLSVGERFTLPAESSHYLCRVLRLREGDRLRLFNGDGREYSGRILAADKKQMLVEVDGVVPGLRPSPLVITLVQAVSRGERLDYSLQKATELGVGRVQLLNSERVELRLSGERLAKRMRHWRQVVVSACEQCGRSDLPELLAPVGLETYLEQSRGRRRLLLDPRAGQSVRDLTRIQKSVDVLVGPEGGFSAEEIAAVSGAGGTAVTLGPRVLRTETAGPAMLAILQYRYGDLF